MVTGIIYKIECCITGEVYYGSTQQGLNRRMTDHKSSFKQWQKGKSPYITSYSIIERGNYSYSLVETVECENKRQLEAREGYYMNNNNCVNKIKPCRTPEQLKEYQNTYYVNNKDKLIEQNKAYIEANKDKTKLYQDAYREANKEKSKEYFRQRYLKQKELI